MSFGLPVNDEIQDGAQDKQYGQVNWIVLVVEFSRKLRGDVREDLARSCTSTQSTVIA